MKLEKIITLANENTRLRFVALERSLRATGCKLPLWVIPYDDNKFVLPENAHWWELPEIINWLNMHQAHKVMRKYQCLLTDHYQFVDADVIFLTNPEITLSSMHGFVTSCGHWHNPGHTYTADVLRFFNRYTTIWQQKVFNSGQFACDSALYNFESLKRTAEQVDFKTTCIEFKYHEQPGLNLLVNNSGVHVTNITLQPYYMESTWAGDYTDNNFERFWKNELRKPYLIHWAGCPMNIDRPIDRLFLEYLNETELHEWKNKIAGISYKKKRRWQKIKAAAKLLFE